MHHCQYTERFSRSVSSLAQSVERWPFKPVVGGSSPPGGVFCCPLYFQKIKTGCEAYSFSTILVSIVVSIPACHAGDPGSIPGRGDYFLPKKLRHAQVRKKHQSQSGGVVGVAATAAPGARGSRTLSHHRARNLLATGLVLIGRGVASIARRGFLAQW